MEQINSSSNKKRNLVQFQAEDILSKLRSKADIFKYLDQHLNFYMPPINTVNKDFLKDVFQDKKILFKKDQVNFICVPRWDELSVKNLWGEMSKDERYQRYMMDEYPKDRLPNREYFFNILNTVYPDYLQQIIRHASKERFSAEGQDAQQHNIEVTKEWYEALHSVPFKSGSKGKTIFLLKNSSKKIAPKKIRRVVPLLGTFQEYQRNENVYQVDPILQMLSKENRVYQLGEGLPGSMPVQKIDKKGPDKIKQ